MNIYKSMFWLLQIFDLCMINHAYMKLYNTEDASAVQSYDCIYYTDVTSVSNETTPYCIRTKESVSLNRSFATNTCKNSGQEWSFRSLKEMNVSQDEILTWNSSIEMADRYAAYLTTGSEELANDKICDCSPNTFGKFCEYEFTTMNTFEETIQYQFHLKQKYRNGSQLWGNITCYTTLTDCYSGLRCLTWHNICDGRQQCMDGIDEDHCEELEYNECEENEYRCGYGSCIPEQFWLDGQYDCSDQTDEQMPFYVLVENKEYLCPSPSYRFTCDEATVRFKEFVCGDGEVLSDESGFSGQCDNYRNIMYFCELTEPPMWTLDNGHCIKKGQIEQNLTDMNELEQCVLYLKCKLTRGIMTGCDDVIRLFHSTCQNKTIHYPSEPVLAPYFQTVYQLSELEYSNSPTYVFFNGSIKCIGYQGLSASHNIRLSWTVFEDNYPFDARFCNYSEEMKTSGPKIDKNCWNDTKQSFLCQSSRQCISKHRLRDGIHDCHYSEDEYPSEKCYMKQQHRLICSSESPACLTTIHIGSPLPLCTKSNDRFITQLKWDLLEHSCTTPYSIECDILKTYIQSPSSLMPTSNNTILEFRHYCNNVWELPRGFDESLCKEWKCPRDQFHCFSGHCTIIPYEYHPPDRWNCPDGSDYIDLLRITQQSEHNVNFIGHSKLEKIKDNLIWTNHRYYIVNSTTSCNEASEYRCLLANINDPLNFSINRPCINMTQIGDGVIDCYGGLDERNLLTCGNNVDEQRGFDFHCDDQQCIPYNLHCDERCSNKADSLLCDQLPILWYSQYSDATQQSICSGYWASEIPQEKIFYCDNQREGSVQYDQYYQTETWRRRRTWTYFSDYPMLKEIVSYQSVQSSQHEIMDNYQHIPNEEEHDGKEGWTCGRGVAIKTNKNNQLQCFCPPSLYGEYCQYFSDRITIIISLHNIPSQLSEQPSNTIKILALLLSNDDIIDYHVFHLPMALSKELNKKFRFNLIHRRPKLSSNRYTVRFEAYHLYLNSSIQFLAVWEYPVQFPFLPSYRLIQILRFEQELTSTTPTHICQTANPCLHNTTCHSIMNKINSTTLYYCHCNNQTFGKHCEHLHQQLTPPSLCSKHAFLRPLSSIKSICLCPIHLFGPTCHLNHTCVNNNPCGINRGICYVNPDNITRDYVCICDKKFFGDHCESDSAMVRINFTDFSFVQTPSNFIMSSIIQLYDLHNETLDLIIQQKRVYQGLPPSITEVYHNYHYLPMFGVMKLYHKYDLSNDYVVNLKQPDYFLLYINLIKIAQMNITLVIDKSNYCPYTPTVFGKNISNVTHLSQLITSNETNVNNQVNTTVMIFRYHRLCDVPYSLLCFYDENYFCLCDNYSRAECSRYISTLDQCHGQCRANGQCVHGDLDNRRDFLCLCPRCYYGSVCQHNTELFSFTLETLFTNDLYSSSLFIQRLFFSLLIIIPIILFFTGAVNNLCCYVTFNRPKPLLIGIGHYLRTASIINQLTLLMLLLKFIHLVLSVKGYIVHYMTNFVLCKVLSYLLVCFCRMSYWLTGMVAIERVYVTWYLKGTWLNSPRIAKRILTTVIIGIMTSEVHQLIYYQSIEDPKSLDMNNSTWCVTSYPSTVATYNQVNIILNYIIPLLINLLSTIIIIILIARKRAAAVAKKNDQTTLQSNNRFLFRTYINLLTKNKELIVAPLMTMLPQLFSLPQLILSFTLACQEFSIEWQRYLLIISYFIMYLPQVLSYKLYISPSSFYTEEFHATKLNQRISGWRAALIRRN